MTAPGVGLITAWGDLRGAMRGVLAARPSEAVLLSFALMSGFLWFLGQIARLWVGPGTAAIPPQELVARVAAEFVSSLLFRTLAMYGLAALGHLIARACGGTGGWRDSRAALFWSFLVAAPVILVAALAALALPGAAGAVVGSLGSVALGVAVAHGVAEAHGFAKAWAVLAVVALMVLAILGVVYVLVRL